MNTTKLTLAVHYGIIIGTDNWTASVYEASDDMTSHSTYGAIDSIRQGLRCKWPGKLMTRKLPKEIDYIPVGEERFHAIDRWRYKLAAICEQAILKALPDVSHRFQFRDGDANEHVPGSGEAIRKARYSGANETMIVEVEVEIDKLEEAPPNANLTGGTSGPESCSTSTED